jgi:hypothetical protein
MLVGTCHHSCSSLARGHCPPMSHLSPDTPAGKPIPLTPCQVLAPAHPAKSVRPYSPYLGEALNLREIWRTSPFTGRGSIGTFQREQRGLQSLHAMSTPGNKPTDCMSMDRNPTTSSLAANHSERVFTRYYSLTQWLTAIPAGSNLYHLTRLRHAYGPWPKRPATPSSTVL